MKAIQSPSKPKVVVIHNILSPHVTPVFQHLATLVDLHVLYCGSTESNRTWKDKPKGFSFAVLPSFSIALKGQDLFTNFFNPTLFKVLSQEKPDVVIISGWDLLSYQLTFLYCQLKKIPCLIWSGSTAYEPSWRRTISKPLVKWMVSRAAGLIAYGTRARDYLVELGADPLKITISFNTTDLKKYHQLTPGQNQKMDKIRQNLKLKNKFVILFYGQLIYRKGVDILLQAAQTLKKSGYEPVVLIIGSGPLKTELQKLASQLRLENVVFIDDPGDAEMPIYYHLAHAFILPSREEVWGLVVNQAMASGLPVVVSDRVGAGPDLVTPMLTGAVFSINEPDQLAKHLITFLSQPQQAKKMGLAAKERIKITDQTLGSLHIQNAVINALPDQFHSKPAVEFISLPTIQDDCFLSIAQSPDIPFSIARIYYMYGLAPGLPRGYHAHYQTDQVLFCLRGSVKIVIDNGWKKESVFLSKPNQGILLRRMIWHEMHDLKKDTILMVLASRKYEAKDYIRNYTEFKNIVRNKSTV
jgi:glycosyltransferase involved in cell wall biosynthesis